jgi:hypothetical protein
MAWFKLVVMLGVIKDDFAGGGKKNARRSSVRNFAISCNSQLTFL